MAHEWRSVPQAADLCGVAYRTMGTMILRDELPAEKPGTECVVDFRYVELRVWRSGSVSAEDEAER